MDEKCILDPQRDCIGKAEAAKLEGRIKALEDWREELQKTSTPSFMNGRESRSPGTPGWMKN